MKSIRSSFGEILGIFATEILKDEGVVGGEFGAGDAGLETRENVDVFTAAHGLGDERERSPDIGSAGIGRAGLADGGEAARHHADDGERLTVEENRLADGIGIGGEVMLPEVVGDDRNVLPFAGVVGGYEVSANFGSDAEHTEIVGARGHSLDVNGGVADGEIVADFGDAGDVLERRGEGAEAAEFGGGQAHLAGLVFVGLGELDDAVGLREWKRSEENAVDDGEDGGVGSDAESEGEDGS